MWSWSFRTPRLNDQDLSREVGRKMRGQGAHDETVGMENDRIFLWKCAPVAAEGDRAGAAGVRGLYRQLGAVAGGVQAS